MFLFSYNLRNCVLQCSQLGLIKIRQMGEILGQKSPPLKMAKISTFYCNIFAKNGQKSPTSPDNFENFAQNRPFFKDAKNRPNFAGDFCKKVVASLTPEIAHLAKNRHSWERWRAFCVNTCVNSQYFSRHALIPRYAARPAIRRTFQSFLICFSVFKIKTKTKSSEKMKNSEKGHLLQLPTASSNASNIPIVFVLLHVGLWRSLSLSIDIYFLTLFSDTNFSPR